jgi:arsenite methyltransferase
VQDRIDIETGDMRALPFPDATFDVVVSSLAIHNNHSNAARAQAIGKAWRVLKPGGRLAIADIRATARYVETLRRLGATAIARRGLGWRFWYGNPFAGTSLVTGHRNGKAREKGVARYFGAAHSAKTSSVRFDSGQGHPCSSVSR